MRNAREKAVLVREERAKGGTLRSAAQRLASQHGGKPDSYLRAHTRYRHEFVEEGLEEINTHGNSKLSKEQEGVLVFTVQGMSLANSPMSNDTVRTLIKDLWAVDVSAAWLTRFAERHKAHLSPRVVKTLCAQRASASIKASVDAFIEEVSDFLHNNHFPRRAVFNYDETLLVQSGGTLALRRLEAKDKPRTNAHMTRGNVVGSLLVFVSADGGLFLSAYVLKARGAHTAQEDPAASHTVRFNVDGRRRQGHQRVYAWTPTGYVNSELFGAIIDTFAELWQADNPRLECVLFGDQLGAHRAPTTLARALQHGIHLVSLPAKTSEFTQPLDGPPFALFGAAVKRNAEEAKVQAAMLGQTYPEAYLDAAFLAEAHAFTPRVVVAAFRDTGLWPFSPETIRRRAVAAVGAVVPPGQAASLPERARAAAASVVKQAKKDIRRRRQSTTRGKAEVVMGQVHTSQSLLALEQKRQEQERQEQEEKDQRRQAKQARREEKEQAQREKAEKRNWNTCQGPGCSRVRRNGSAWWRCECGQFVLCRACSFTKEGQDKRDGHKQQCNASG